MSVITEENSKTQPLFGVIQSEETKEKENCVLENWGGPGQAEKDSRVGTPGSRAKVVPRGQSDTWHMLLRATVRWDLRTEVEYNNPEVMDDLDKNSFVGKVEPEPDMAGEL